LGRLKIVLRTEALLQGRSAAGGDERPPATYAGPPKGYIVRGLLDVVEVRTPIFPRGDERPLDTSGILSRRSLAGLRTLRVQRDPTKKTGGRGPEQAASRPLLRSTAMSAETFVTAVCTITSKYAPRAIKRMALNRSGRSSTSLWRTAA